MVTTNSKKYYKDGIVFCSHCNIGFKYLGYKCPCCGMSVRRIARNKTRVAS